MFEVDGIDGKETITSEKFTRMFASMVPRDRQKRALLDMAREIVKLQRKRIRAQKNLDGSNFAPRKDREGKATKKKALKRMWKQRTRRGATHTMKQRSEARMDLIHLAPFATEHQEGRTYSYSAYSRPDRKQGGFRSEHVNYASPCTRDQASYLRDHWKDIWESGTRFEEFEQTDLQKYQEKQRQKERRKQKPKKERISIAYLRRTYTMGAAGFLIRQYRKNTGREDRTRWSFHLPERHVLGITQKEEQQLLLKFYGIMKRQASY